MRTAKVLAVSILALSSISLLAQQTDSNPQQQPPQQMAPAAQPSNAAAVPSAAEMSSISGELVDKLDSKTAKTGDSVVIKTRSNAKTADGTEIPKGSKLVGHITAVQPSGSGSTNSQMSLQFDRIELKGGQSVAVRSELQSLSPAESDVPATSDAMPSGSSSPVPSASPSAGGMPGGSGAPAATASAAPVPSQSTPRESTAAPGQSGAPAPGTEVARNGNIAIRTTAIPGVLLASNEPGQQDPRLAQSSGILLGAKRDIHLDGGTKVVIGVAAAGASSTGR